MNVKGVCSMSRASRVLLCILALSLSFINSPLAQSQSSSAVPSSPQSLAESAVRAVVEKYFALYGAEDLNGVMSLWSEKSPNYASLKQNLQRQGIFTTNLSVSKPGDLAGQGGKRESQPEGDDQSHDHQSEDQPEARTADSAQLCFRQRE